MKKIKRKFRKVLILLAVTLTVVPILFIEKKIKKTGNIVK